MQDSLSGQAYLLVEGANLIGEHAVFVRQETEAPLLLQQGLSAAVSDELLHVHLSRRDGLHILRTGSEGGSEVRTQDS